MQKVYILSLILFSFLLIGCKPAQKTETGGINESLTSRNSVKIGNFSVDDMAITATNHATFTFTFGDTVFYNDPTGGAEQFADSPNPDIVLVSDIHGDHLSLETLEAVVGEATLIVPQAVADELPEDQFENIQILENGEVTEINGVRIEAMPMYNLPQSEESRHIKGRGNGYLLENKGFQVYIAGDTGPIDEMKALTEIDVAFVPMNLPYTMGIEEAADAVIAFAPNQVVPYHYRGQDGLADLDEFEALVKARNSEIDVALLDWYPQE